MATRTIVTSQPDVACDVCGRRLLRGEHPDVFLVGGQRRMVCELCVPRAAHEGWLREDGALQISPTPPRGQRGRSLLGRLRQLREPDVAQAGGTRGAEEPEPEPEPEPYDFFDGSPEQTDEDVRREADPRRPRSGPPSDPQPSQRRAPAQPWPVPTRGSSPEARASGERSDVGQQAVRAIEVFNAGEQPRRVAGLTRSLGAPSVTTRLGADSSRVTIVVAWELCWYRYEVDLGDEGAGARLAAQGMELNELAAEDQLANAAADERGEIAPLDL